MPGILELFALQNGTKMKKIGDHYLFFASLWKTKLLNTKPALRFGINVTSQ
jgi:hypothetical protein